MATSPSGAIRVRLNKPQSKAYRRVQPGNTVCLRFGRGVGKTIAQRLIWYLLIAKWDGIDRGHGLRGIRIVLLTPTFKQAIDTYAALVLSELSGEWSFLGATINKTRWRIDFPGGSWIQFFGAENAESARGLRCDVASLDECDDIDQGVFDAVVQPWFSEPWSLKMKIASGTPKRGRYGLLYKLWKAAEDGVAGHYAFYATYRDVPENVSAEYVEAVRATMGAATFKREWEADMDAGEGLVFPMFSVDFHVRAPPDGIRWAEVVVGMDHGYEDPAVHLACGVLGSGRDAIVWVIDEFYKTHQSQSELLGHAEALRERYASDYPMHWYADPSRPDQIREYRGRGIQVESAKNSIEDGVAAVADRMAIREHESASGDTVRASKLYIAPHCVNLIRELGMYRRRRDPRDKERVLDDIEDRNNHAIDALRYAIFSRFGGIGLATRFDYDPYGG